MRRRGLVSQMYAAARVANDISTLASGDPRRPLADALALTNDSGGPLWR